ncbi:MAG: Putative RNA polymerase sigma factor [uncultured Corynebacteriales bacterium]|uniref:RNA polymerase sigma factor n=1 Tax=uncultured Mycobacteriales bacterium TaxID=581187 RepID=A0A6J4I1N0_9ACTN|nr:MAG: Putative RNA polymerase sigma factor [uncultured Corynebacteriales bacterium]
MVRTAYLLTGDLTLAEDVVQTALASLLVSWRRVRSVANVDAYVHSAIVNAGRRSWRRTWRELPVAELPERALPDPSSRYGEYDEVVAALRALPPRQRAAVVLRYYDDLSEAETARVLGCSVGTVKSQTARGLDKLRVRLAGATVDGRTG